ncbi:MULTISPECIES: tRNA pseudouridine(38-40) synthase TruA [Acetobacter]|uniref:tRNA pseudouridine synthase A n=1 Tax=Acetobacter thailandicus TaxID=1502842 RepID=A0ABT3QBQ0_9PROT|nr:MULTISPECIES: tRNA pseudouridine(38-40) synthase TruA [Acetobacter]MBS0959112.1 tRNA pseudouridine(38-40) synthase TruA [Acetobacter thailandicus]MBS0980466.1 tRNA pseudouridine(38-40) synthase TruA [Acetobacter thailandicus]MBS1003460.1 tRNA pseudouridine(38-40) synthase TruA [Acetobacter thailandicus]MCX2562706.1 tRNA pseudouridine(38-40) synthase TruA [Acetobacter thailandicus]NHN94771.1 tRNA pseudouridine(38-40) synthase TruA [Acetobacter thailandicus]
MTETSSFTPQAHTGSDDLSSSIQRWAVKVEYNGTGLVGWQRQTNGPSVQEFLEHAASCIAGKRTVNSITAGRTDAGVHATGQVAHLDFPADIALKPHQVRDGLSYYLKPHAIAVIQAAPVPPDWSARFSATWRSYRYRILNRPTRAALGAGLLWHVRGHLDIDLMQEAGNHLLGLHDFTSFRAAACQANSPVRSIDHLHVARHDDEVHVTVKARSFLHHQVRNIVGTLVLTGHKRWKPERVAEALAARRRSAAGPTAPPDGLYLTGVGYDPDPFA